MTFDLKALGRALGVLFLIAAVSGCIRSPTFPTPDEGDEGGDGPDTGGPSALAPGEAGSPEGIPSLHFV